MYKAHMISGRMIWPMSTATLLMACDAPSGWSQGDWGILPQQATSRYVIRVWTALGPSGVPSSIMRGETGSRVVHGHVARYPATTELACKD